MTSPARIEELDRNMDTVFDNLLAINTFLEALAQSLDPSTAAGVVQRMDPRLDEAHLGANPPGVMGMNLLFGLRNCCARLAEVPIRRPK